MLYDLAIVIYDFIVHLAAPFSRKPRKMMKGHWVVYELLRQQVEKGEQYIWFHAASLGEFEQGRPLIEMIREKYPNYKILLTFFPFITKDSKRVSSPSAVPNSRESTTGGSESPFDSMVTPMPSVMQLKTFMIFFLNS